jgi:hypothetical protein
MSGLARFFESFFFKKKTAYFENCIPHQQEQKLHEVFSAVQVTKEVIGLNSWDPGRPRYLIFQLANRVQNPIECQDFLQ